ncbi:MAG: hypothetical protein LBB67_01265 [Oscillospiraceae bacterium]|nr:hypothetical protein [Oscillospiraceae bacterium]
MKFVRKSVSILLALTMLLGVSAVAGSAETEVESYPIILIHGLGQSNVRLFDENNELVLDDDGNTITNFPPPIDVMSLVSDLLFPLLLSLFFQTDVGLVDAIRTAANNLLPAFKMDENGFPTMNMRVETYPNSLADCTDAQKQFIYSTLPVQDLAKQVGEDKIYYFAYDSLGNNDEITERLYKMIGDVKEEHDSPKVNIAAVSLGGTFMNSLLEYHPDVVSSLNSIVYVIAALDGSRIVGDIYTGNIAQNDADLYRDLFPALVPGYLGSLINVAIRLFPKSLLHGIFDSLVNALAGDLISYSTTMWSLCPSGDYEEARAMWLMDGKHDEILEQTDRYYQAQKNSDANILAAQAAGVKVYAIAEYNVPLYSIAGSYKEYNADGIIHLDSTSLGATSGYVDTPLPEDYKQQKHTDHNYMSPDRIVDASTGALPDYTFYFKNQAHESTAQCDVIMSLVVRLLTADEYEDVFSMPEWPQFNHGRRTRSLRNDLLPQAQSIDAAALAPEDAAELEAAIQQAETMLKTTIVVPEETDAAIERLQAILVKLGKIEASKEDTTAQILDPIFKFVDDALYWLRGARGFSDPFWVRWQ